MAALFKLSRCGDRIQFWTRAEHPKGTSLLLLRAQAKRNSLRERREDIPLLIEHFWHASGYGKTEPHLPSQVVSRMVDYEWSGNVRELQNTLHRFVAFDRLDFLGVADSDENSADSVDLNIEPVESSDRPLHEVVVEFEKRDIGRLLEGNQWSRTRVASILGIGRKTLYRKMKSCGIISHENGL